MSDFAGVFLFPLFFAALVPNWKRGIYFFTIVGFAFWKFPYSQGLIDSANGVLPIKIGRTVDPTDLIALSVLPLSWLCARTAATSSNQYNRVLKSVVAIIVSMICIFAFGATSTMEPEQILEYNKDYQFEFSRSDLVQRLSQLQLSSFSVKQQSGQDPDNAYLYKARLDNDICTSAGGRVEMKAYSRPLGKSILRLLTIRYNCNARVSGDQEKLLQEFEQRIVNGLRVGAR